MFRVVVATMLLAFVGGCRENKAPPPITIPTVAVPKPAPRVELGRWDEEAGRDPFEEPLDQVSASRPKKAGRIELVSDTTRDERHERAVLPDSTVDQVRVAAVLEAGAESRAMIVGPNGQSFTLKQGDLLGREEVVTADEAEVLLHWRVDRIRQSELRLVLRGRNVKPVFKVLPVRSEAEDQALQ